MRVFRTHFITFWSSKMQTHSLPLFQKWIQMFEILKIQRWKRLPTKNIKWLFRILSFCSLEMHFLRLMINVSKGWHSVSVSVSTHFINTSYVVCPNVETKVKNDEKCSEGPRDKNWWNEMNYLETNYNRRRIIELGMKTDGGIDKRTFKIILLR